MALRIPVKIGNITNLSDARYGAGMGVDYLGFPIGHGLSLEKFKDIAGWLSGPQLIVEVEELHPGWQPPLPDFIYQIDVAQANAIGSLAPTTRLVISGTGPELLNALPYLESTEAEILFLEVTDPNSLENIHLDRLAGSFNVWIAVTNTSELDRLAQRPFSGIALRGSEEAHTGLKDYGTLAEILETLEVNS